MYYGLFMSHSAAWCRLAAGLSCLVERLAGAELKQPSENERLPVNAIFSITSSHVFVISELTCFLVQTLAKKQYFSQYFNTFVNILVKNY